MPPKKETTSADGTKLLTGFEDKVSLHSRTPHIQPVLICPQETKLLAAAFVSCIGTDKVSDNIHLERNAHLKHSTATRPRELQLTPRSMTTSSWVP